LSYLNSIQHQDSEVLQGNNTSCNVLFYFPLFRLLNSQPLVEQIRHGRRI